jgi:hypothetical protein
MKTLQIGPEEPARVYVVVGLVKATHDPIVVGVYPDKTRAEAGAWRALHEESTIEDLDIQERVLND